MSHSIQQQHLQSSFHRAGTATAPGAPATNTALTKSIGEHELNQPININLCESEMFWILEIPSVCVSADSAEEPVVRAQVQRYKEVVVVVIQQYHD
jgi:hypothetical protein